jgi:DNA-binding XRE family transcriptional regulator
MSTPAELKSLRIHMNASQATMAKAMGVPLRTYRDIEAQRSAFKPIHWTAAQMAAIKIAAEIGGYARLPLEIGNVVRRAATAGRLAELFSEPAKTPSVKVFDDLVDKALGKDR